MVGFDPISYTVTEGDDEFVRVTIVRMGNIDLTANVNLTTVPGTADGTYIHCMCEISMDIHILRECKKLSISLCVQRISTMKVLLLRQWCLNQERLLQQ